MSLSWSATRFHDRIGVFLGHSPLDNKGKKVTSLTPSFFNRTPVIHFQFESNKLRSLGEET